jgi:hypothetical protein
LAEPEDALAPVLASSDPVERVGFATRFLLEGGAARQRAARAMIAATAGALFVLTDQCGLPEADAIDSATRTATTLTKMQPVGDRRHENEPVSN